ncbi:MAG: peptidylprolyl isomerase [Enterovibrio sp.]
MMERLRAGANNLVIKIILGLIILSFLFAGVGSYLTGGSAPFAAKVGSVEISQQQFEQSFQNERQQMQAQAGDMFTALMADPNYLAQFRSSVLERMINQNLLDQYAQKLGLRASDELVKETIRAMPAFSSNGEFNNDQYLALLNQNGLTPETFAQYVRSDLVRAQLLDSLQESEFVLEHELKNIYQLEEQSRTIRTLTLPLADFASKVTLTEQQKEEYYQQNSNQFMRPEQYKIAYVELSGETLADKIAVSDDEVKEYYQSNQATYTSAPQRKISHILTQGDDAKEKAQAILQQLKDGADFATLAQEKSQDAFSAKRGGELDWFEKGVVDPAVEKSAFALENKGDISDVVQSDFGYHIIKLDDFKLAQVTPFEQVKEEILAALKMQKAADAFYGQSTLLAEKAFELPDSLDEAAQAVNATVQKTDFIELSKASGILASPSVRQALSLKEVRDGLNSELIEIAPEHVAVVRIEAHRPAEVLPFAQVEGKVTMLLQQKLAAEQMQTLAAAMIKELEQSESQAQQQSGYQFAPAQDVKRYDADPAAFAFTLKAPQQGHAYGFTRARNGDVVVIALDKVTPADVSNVDLKQLLAERVQRMLSSNEIEALLSDLKNEFDVVYSPTLFSSQG